MSHASAAEAFSVARFLSICHFSAQTARPGTSCHSHCPGGTINTQAGNISIVHSFNDVSPHVTWTGVMQDTDGIQGIFSGVRGVSTGGMYGMGGAGGVTPIQ